MKKIHQTIIMLFISILYFTTHAQDWVKCYEPKGFTIFYNSEKDEGTIELKDFIPEKSDRLDFARWIGTEEPVASLIWNIELSKDLSMFRIRSIKGYGENGKLLGLCPLKHDNEDYANWHAIFPAENVYKIHAAIALDVKTEIFDKQ